MPPASYVIEWDGRLFATAGNFRAHIISHGVSWTAFLGHHPAVPVVLSLPYVDWEGSRFYSQAQLAGWLRDRNQSYARWAQTHPLAADILAGRSGAGSRVVASTRHHTKSPLVMWDGIPFTAIGGFKLYLADSEKSAERFLATHPAVARALGIRPVMWNGRPVFTVHRLVKLLRFGGVSIAHWRALHPGAVEKLM